MVIQKDFHFEAAHVLSNYAGACGNLHGHSYTGKVKLFGDTDARSRMVRDFNDISAVIQTLDHAVIFSDVEFRDSFETELFELCCRYNKKYVVIEGGKCTAEDIARWICHQVGMYSCNVYLKETASSEVIYG